MTVRMTSAAAIFALCATTTAVAAPSIDVRVRTDLRRDIDALLAGPALKGAEIGLHVVRLPDGVELYSHEADQLLIPASNIKILTTAAALHYLSPDYRFRTKVFAEVDGKGIVAGNLYVKGHGDPWLVPERLWFLASRIYFLGVRAVRGNIIIDDSYFDGSPDANGYEQDSSTSSYMAKSSAFSVGFNSLLVHILPASEPGQPAKILIDPISRYAKVKGTVTTVARRRSIIDVNIEPHNDRSIVKVSGRISIKSNGRGYWRRVDNPPVFSGEVLKAMLRQVGIGVKGRVKVGVVPEDAERLVSLSSPRLADLVGRVNKHSNNFMAAQIARTLGAEVYGAPGTWAKGRRAIEAFLADEVGIERGTYMLGNASGLHDVNRLSPRQVYQILAYVYAQPHIRPEFVASLAVAGGAGTLSDRMADTDAVSLLRAKTGTLSTASALSGYVTCASGEVVIFSIIVNGYTVSIHDVWKAQDELGAMLAGLDFAATKNDETATKAPSADVAKMP
ncbi:MAG: D-alanyl-D-alanine carboxypeptidase/D-alanyl-D-alanine-endopeptidase [Myxococcota bacterium]